MPPLRRPSAAIVFAQSSGAAAPCGCTPGTYGARQLPKFHEIDFAIAFSCGPLATYAKTIDRNWNNILLTFLIALSSIARQCPTSIVQ